MIRQQTRQQTGIVVILGLSILLLAFYSFKQQHDLQVQQRRLDALINGNRGAINLNHALINDAGLTVQQLLDQMAELRAALAADPATDAIDAADLTTRMQALQAALDARINALERRTNATGQRGPQGAAGAHGPIGATTAPPTTPMIITPPASRCPLGAIGPVCIIRTVRSF